MICRIVPPSKFAVKPSNRSRARLKSDDTSAETRFGLSAKRTCPVKLAVGQSSRLLAAEVWASAVVMVVMLYAPCSDTQCKTTGYPLHSNISPSLPLPCVTLCLRFQLSSTCVRRYGSFRQPYHSYTRYTNAFPLLSLRWTRNFPNKP